MFVTNGDIGSKPQPPPPTATTTYVCLKTSRTFSYNNSDKNCNHSEDGNYLQ